MRGIAAALAVLLVLVASPANAHRLKVKHLEQVSPTPDLPAACLNPGEGPPNSDVEPHIAVNPTDHRNLIATWWIGQQDFRDRAQAGGVAYSNDGGRTWRASVIPGVDACSGGPLNYTDGAHDTWVSFDPDGRAYLIAFSFGSSERTFFALTSDNGGRRWSRPNVIVRGTARDDKPTITADPIRPDTAYAVWTRYDQEAIIGDAYLSRSVDGGRNWSVPRLIFSPVTAGAPPNSISAYHQVLVAPDGTLVDVFIETNVSTFSTNPFGEQFPSRVAAIRSTDGGESWSDPVEIGQLFVNRYVSEPGGEGLVDLYPGPSAAIDGTGRLSVVWTVYEEGGSSRVNFAQSTDEGRSWSEPARIGSDRAFQPVIGAANDGRLGLQYYDLSTDQREDRRWTARWRFAHSDDRGETWRQRWIGPEFNLRLAPQRPERGGHSFLGDYTGLDGAGGGFVAAFAASRPFTEDGPSDIWVARLRPKR